MKVWLDERGGLFIEGDSKLEDYALRKWRESWGAGKDSRLYICLPNPDGVSVAPTIVLPLPDPPSQDSPSPACGEE